MGDIVAVKSDDIESIGLVIDEESDNIDSVTEDDLYVEANRQEEIEEVTVSNHAILEGILFTTGHSVELGVLASAIDMTNDDTRFILEELKDKLNAQDRGVMLIELDGSYQLCTKREIYSYLIKIAKAPRKYTLTDSLLETLSIIAYNQPITRLEIEKIRGVNCDHAVNRLIEFNLVCELGRMEAPGRPIIFGTTEEFLRSFGVRTLGDLPGVSSVRIEEFKEEAIKEAMELEV